MDHPQDNLEERIAAYLDGQLSPAEAARLEVHLANAHPSLAEQVIGMSADKHSLRSMPKVAAPADMAARVMEQVERAALLSGTGDDEAPHRPRFRAQWAMAAAVLLVIGGISFVVVETLTAPDGGASWIGNGLKQPLASKDSPAAGDLASRDVHSTTSVAAVTDDTGRQLAAGSAPPVGIAAPSPAAAPMGLAPVPVESAADAITRIESHEMAASGPVVLTLAARSSQDLDRLRLRLAEWAPSQVAPNTANTDANGAGGNQGQALRQNNMFDQQNGFDNRRSQELPRNGNYLNNEQQKNGSNLANGSASGPGAPVTYRVSLSREQLDELSRDFRVTGVGQGPQSYVIDASRAAESKSAMGPGAAAPATGRPMMQAMPGAATTAPALAANDMNAEKTPAPRNAPAPEEASTRNAVAGTYQPRPGGSFGSGGRGGGAGMGGFSRGGGRGGGGGGGARGDSSTLGGSGGSGVAPQIADTPAVADSQPAPDAGSKALPGSSSLDTSKEPGDNTVNPGSASKSVVAPMPIPPEGAPASTTPATIDCLIQITPPPEGAP